MERDWFFDGDYSESYFAMNEHADKEEFAKWIEEQEKEYGYDDIIVDRSEIEYYYAKEINEEKFEKAEKDDEGAFPITRYKV